MGNASREKFEHDDYLEENKSFIHAKYINLTKFSFLLCVCFYYVRTFQTLNTTFVLESIDLARANAEC